MLYQRHSNTQNTAATANQQLPPWASLQLWDPSPLRFRESSLVGVAHPWVAHPCTTPLTMLWLWVSSILSIRVPNDAY